MRLTDILTELEGQRDQLTDVITLLKKLVGAGRNGASPSTIVERARAKFHRTHGRTPRSTPRPRPHRHHKGLHWTQKPENREKVLTMNIKAARTRAKKMKMVHRGEAA